MPLYVYSCPTCEIEVEELRPMKDATMPFVCPVCHKIGVREITSFTLWRGGSQQHNQADTSDSWPRSFHGGDCVCCR